jgi:hypothetical protein
MAQQPVAQLAQTRGTMWTGVAAMTRTRRVQQQQQRDGPPGLDAGNDRARGQEADDAPASRILSAPSADWQAAEMWTRPAAANVSAAVPRVSGSSRPVLRRTQQPMPNSINAIGAA